MKTRRALALLPLLATSILAEPPKEAAVPFLTPEQAIAKMTYPDGFVVNAFAAEPGCQQPFAFTFDERGRIWLCENLNYETRKSDLYDKGPLGRIVILTDTDGDGAMDERKVFRDKIYFPTGIELGHGGVFVGSPPNLLFIPDRNRDDVPDAEPEIILDGWGRQDRHETLNSFRWGPDGWLYGTHGVFTHSKVGKPGTPDNERVPLNAGVWRYHPVNEKFEVFAWGTSNPWGLDFDDKGQCFITACVIPHLWHMIQGGRYHRQGGKHFNPYVYDDIKTIADHKHASAHGGATFYLADQYPEEYRGRLFMCNIHEHGVLTDILERKGSGFVGKHGDHFCMANDAQWLGFNTQLGPDGSFYAIDWHDSDICGRKIMHQKTGRIWRISYGEAKFPVGMDLTKKTDEELVAMHLHPNHWYVRVARRLLQERALEGKIDPRSHGGLRLILDKNPDVSRRLQAMWTLQLIGGLGDGMLTPMLSDKEEYIRAWAIQLIAEDGRVDEPTLQKWAAMAKDDESAVVRLYLASAMQRVNADQRWAVMEALVAHEEDKDDHNLPLMLWYATEPLVMNDPAKIAKIAASSKISKVSEYIARRLGDGNKTTKTAPPAVKPKKAPAAKSVSDQGLALHLEVGAIEAEGITVSKWGDAVQAATEAKPEIRDSLGGRKAIWFDGRNDALVLPHRTDLAFGKKDSFTVAAWVYQQNPQSSWQTILTKSREKKPWYGLWIDPGGRWLAGGTDNMPGSRATEGWHHVCLVQGGGKFRALFVDGFQVARGSSQAGEGEGAMWIGGSPTVREFYRGGINEVRIYRRALSAGEVTCLAERPVGVVIKTGAK